MIISVLRATMLLAVVAANPLHAQHAPAEIRVWGFDGMKPLLLRWEAAYARVHPEVRFHNTLNGAASAMAGLYNGVADVVVMGREIWPVDTMAYHWVFQHQPFGLVVVTAGLNAPAQSFSPVVIVNAKNPLTSISISQLDAIYGSEHRLAKANARTWRDLGLTGVWATRTIHPFGYGPEDALGVYFRHDILHSDFKPNPESHLLSDRDPQPAGSIPAADRIAQAVAGDLQAIGYTSAKKLRAGVKAIPVSGLESGDIPPTEQTLLDHAYPLTRTLSLFVNRTPDKPLPPLIDNFLRFVLSAEAQEEVRPGEGFLPLSPSQAHHELERLNAPMPPKPKGSTAEDKP